MTRCHSASGKSSSGARCWTPALLTRMSSGPELRLHRRDAGVDRLAVGDVERDVMHVAPACRGSPLRGACSSVCGIAPVQRDRAARLDQPLRERAADPAARAGDERGAPADVEHAVRHAAVMSTFADASASSAVRMASGAS